MQKKLFITLIMFLAASLSFSVFRAVGQNNVVGALQLDDVDIAVGETRVVHGRFVCAVTSCQGFEIVLRFDPTAIWVDDITLGGYLGSDALVQAVSIDNDNGLVSLAASTPLAPPSSTDDILFTLTIIGLKAGETAVTVETFVVTGKDVSPNGMVIQDSAQISILLPTVPLSSTATPTALPTEAVEAVDLANSVVVNPQGEVVIGMAASFSGEGLAPLGIDERRGVELALEDRPTVIVDGIEFPISLDAQDDLCSAEGGQAVANRFASDSRIVAVIGPMCSSACRAAAPIFDSVGYSTITPSCTAADLSNSGYTSFNRAVVSDASQGRVAASYLYLSLGVQRLATIHDGSSYGEGLIDIVSRHFEELGGEIVAADAVSIGDTDFRGLLEDIAAEDPDAIYFGGFPAEASRLAIQRADVGLDDVIFMGADGIKTQEFIDLAGDASEGVYVTRFIPAVNPTLESFLIRYEETYGEEPPAPFHSNAYDAANIILDAIEAVGIVSANGDLVIDRAALSEYIRTVSEFEGLTGTLTADGTGELASAEFQIDQVQDGEFVQVALVHS